MIDPVSVQSMLGDARGRFDIDSLQECDSTSTLLLKRAAEGAPAGSVIVTDRQTAGRGSRGRGWLASPESSLTFSVLWRFDGGVGQLAGLSLAVGVAVVHALEAFDANGIMLKWPNDILYDNAKLGGILVELQSAPDSALAVAQLLVELAHVFDRFSYGGFAVLRDQWQALNAWQNHPVRLLRNGLLEKEGVCRGADLDGALLVQTSAGVERCLSGDLSLRAQ